MPSAIPDLKALATGSVRGRHVLILFGLAFLLTLFIAYQLSKSIDPLFRLAWQSVLWGTLTFVFFAIVTVCVPELRRLFREVVRSGQRANASDVVITIAVMLTWGLGASRILFNYPVILFDEASAYRWLDLGPKREPGPVFLFLAAVSGTILAPLTEEVVFRGYLLNLWLARYRTWVAVWGSSIAFGLWHFQNAPFATVMGVFFGMLYLKYRSLILCMVLHGLYNLLMLRVLLGQFFMDKDRATVAALSSWWLEIVLAMFFIPALYLFIKRFRPQSAISS